MERTRYTPKLIKGFKKADAILCSDIHLREDTPTCFTGDFQKEQWVALDVIKIHQELHNCPVYHAGDLFHHWKPSPWLLSKTMQYIPNNFHTVLGQHDLPQHNLDLVQKSGVWTLMEAGKVKLLHSCHYGQTPDQMMVPLSDITKHDILIWHRMTYIQPPYPGATGGNARQVLMKYPQYKLIVTGDNHQSFSIGHDGRLLVNPGNMTRQVADQIDFQPRVALWYADTNTIEWINLPKQENVITREHIERKEARTSRIEAFIKQLNMDDWKAELSFEENLENFFVTNDVREPVKQIIYKAIDNESD